MADTPLEPQPHDDWASLLAQVHACRVCESHLPLPPRPDCATTWRARLLARLIEVRLVLAVGRYAHLWHLPDTARYQSVSQTVADWQRHWPTLLPLPHPSPRNTRWLRERPWFDADVLPALRQRVREVLN